MHELQVTERILAVVLRHAAMNNVTKVLSIQLRIGELSGLEDEWIQRYFDYQSRGTIAEYAKLNIERTPVVMKCDDCGYSYEVGIREMKDSDCPECSSIKSTLISGKEYSVVDMKAR
jgi:hydrogenase nickel incorporation protein HypA/HybF